jgi:hypothetical protein
MGNELDLSFLKAVLDYSPATGVFTWKATRGGKLAGSKAGRVRLDGTTDIKLRGKMYLAHRLAWFYMTGVWPSAEIDHKDVDASNNAWHNLRPATGSQNCCNRLVQANNRLGVKGVRKDKNKYAARITVSRKTIHLGTFETPEEAALAYAKAAKELHGAFARVG